MTDITDINEPQIVNIKIPVANENLREELNFYRELRTFFKEYDKPVEDIDFVIGNIEADLEKFSEVSRVVLDEEKIVALLERHPYFKNPGDYPIRLLTLLKYLKEKGVNMHYADIDVYIDRLVQKMDGVKKVDKGLYKKTK